MRPFVITLLCLWSLPCFGQINASFAEAKAHYGEPTRLGKSADGKRGEAEFVSGKWKISLEFIGGQVFTASYEGNNVSTDDVNAVLTSNSNSWKEVNSMCFEDAANDLARLSPGHIQEGKNARTTLIEIFSNAARSEMLAVNGKDSIEPGIKAATGGALAGTGKVGSPNRPVIPPLESLKPNELTPHGDVDITGESFGGKDRTYQWITDYGSYSFTDLSKRVVAVTVTNKANVAQRVRVQIFWITRNLDLDQKQYAIISDTKVEVPARGTTDARAQAESTQAEENYVYLNLKNRAGDKYLGWTARIVDGSGAIVAVRSGLPEHDKVARTAPLDGDGTGSFR